MVTQLPTVVPGCPPVLTGSVLCSVMCVVNVSPVQAVDLNFCDSAWDVILPGQ